MESFYDATNINLIGYRCSGKSLVGQQLAEALSWHFVDADAVLVAEAGLSVTEIVAESGWPGFRQLESRILSKLWQKDKIVLATGGGVVLASENRRMLKESGVNFWLQVNAATVFKRHGADATSSAQRPALSSMSLEDEIASGLKEREPFYREIADYSIEVDDLNVAEIVKWILAVLGSRRVA